MNEDLLKRLMYRYTASFFVINLSETLILLIDQLIVSRNLGATAMAAMGLSTPAFTIMLLLCSCFTIGMQTLCSKAMNCGDSKKITAVFNTGVMIVGIVAVLATAVGLFGLDYVCILFGADPKDTKLFNSLREYMEGLTLGMGGYMGYILFSPLAALEGKQKVVTATTIIQNILNIAGDLLSVKVLDLGIWGIGISTGVSWLVSFAIMIPFFLRRNSTFRIKLMKPDLKALVEMTVIGSTKFTKYLSKIFSKLIINRLMLFFGSSLAMSAISVNHSLNGLVLVIGVGVSECINLCTQMAYTERDRKYLVSMMRRARKMVLSVTSLTVLLMVVMLIFADRMASFFVIDQPELCMFTAFSLRCMAVQIPINAVNCVLIAYLQGSKRIKLTNVMNFVHRFVSPAVFTLLLGAAFGIYGVFIALPVGEFAVAALYLIIAFRKSPKGIQLIERVLMLAPDFEEGIKADITFSVSNADDVVRVSRQVSDFLVSAGVEDKPTIYKASLCLEEMASNVVKYGFTQDSRKHSCDIRVLTEADGSILLRIRDDCRLFDVKERYDCIDKGDIFSNIGIKLVFSVADEVAYIKLLGLNTVQIRIKPSCGNVLRTQVPA